MKKLSKTLAAILLVVTTVFAAGCGNGNGIGKNNSDSTGGHDYVDLGLPSGTLWATCNVGANTPEEYGDYFAWGETQTKSVYSWDTYKHCNGDYELTKYNVKLDYDDNDFVDGLTILQPTDDAATANWGNGWCTPTEEQWEELIQNTTSTWTTQNGMSGRLFTASNGQSLFLPAAGRRWSYELNDPVGIGNYWSSSLDTYGPGIARYFYFYSDGYDMTATARSDGHSVRPVRSVHRN